MKKEQYELIARLEKMGFTYDEANALRRIEMTLRRWFELECGNGNDYSSWAIERDEETDKPFMVTHPHTGKSYRRAIPDREAGARKRLAKIIDARNLRQLVDDGSRDVVSYVQGDPRGASLYIIRKSDIREGEDINSIYNRGLCVFG